jgi:predicted GNAT family acetyltransferase
VLRTQRAVRVLGPGDLDEVTALLARDPVVNVVADFRARTTRMEPRWLGGEMWGYYEDDALVSVCHSAANLIPAMATPAALERFADRALRRGPTCAAIVGRSADVATLWDRLETEWPAPRDVREGQPHLEISSAPLVEPDPLVRRSTLQDLDLLYPACVAMHTEEVGVSPESNGGGPVFHAGVTQLVGSGRSFVRVDDGRVVFKAELAAVTPHACQVQGVYVAPDLRGTGLGTAGMAAVVAEALREVAPVVSLYANAYNGAALRVYERVGFRQTATFTTILF